MALAAKWVTGAKINNEKMQTYEGECDMQVYFDVSFTALSVFGVFFL